jgi:hypothetical protein
MGALYAEGAASAEGWRALDLLARIRSMPGWFDGVSGLSPELRSWDRLGAPVNLTEPDSESNAYPRWLSLEEHPEPEPDQETDRIVHGFEIKTPSNSAKPRINAGLPVWQHRRRAKHLPNLAPAKDRRRAANAERAKQAAARTDRRSEAELLKTFTTPLSVECLAQQDHDCGTKWKVLPSDLDELGRAECPTCGELTVVLAAEPAESTTTLGTCQTTRVYNPAPVWRKDSSRPGGKKWKTQIKIVDLAARQFEDDVDDATDWPEYTSADAISWGAKPTGPRREQRKGTDVGRTALGQETWMPSGHPEMRGWTDVVVGALRAAKAAVLAHEKDKSRPDPRKLGATLPKPPGAFTGRAHARDMLRDVQRLTTAMDLPLPNWITARLLDALLDAVSFDAAGDGQIKTDTLRALLASRGKLAAWIREYADDRASEFTQKGDRRAVTLPYARAVKLLVELHALADAVDDAPKTWQAKIADLSRSANKKHKRHAESVAWYKLLSLRESEREHEEATIDPREMKQARSSARADHAVWFAARDEHQALRRRRADLRRHNGSTAQTGGGFVAQCDCRREHCRCPAGNATPAEWAAHSCPECREAADKRAAHCSCPSWLRIDHAARTAHCIWCKTPPAELPGVAVGDREQRYELREVFAEAAKSGGAEPVSESKPGLAGDPDWWWKAKAEPFEMKCKDDSVRKLYRWVQIPYEPTLVDDWSAGRHRVHLPPLLIRSQKEMHDRWRSLERPSPESYSDLWRAPYTWTTPTKPALPPASPPPNVEPLWSRALFARRNRVALCDTCCDWGKIAEKPGDTTHLDENPTSAPGPLEERGAEHGAPSAESVFLELPNVAEN